MRKDKFNQWRWILLGSASILSLFFSVLIGFEVWDDTFAIILFLIIIAIVIALTIILLVSMNTVTRRFRIALMILFGTGVVFWFISTLPTYNGESAKHVRWMFDAIALIFAIGGLFLLYISYLGRTILTIPLMIAAIIAGLILNRLGARSEAEFLIFEGYFLLTIGLLKEAVSSRKQFGNHVFLKRLYLIVCSLLTICTGILFVQYASYEVDRLGIYDLLEVIVFLMVCAYLFIAMPFSDFIEWNIKNKVGFYRIILIPVIFLFLTISLRFVLPIETYKKVFFKEHAKSTIYFGMKDYKLKEDTEKDTYQK